MKLELKDVCTIKLKDFYSLKKDWRRLIATGLIMWRSDIVCFYCCVITIMPVMTDHQHV